MTSRRPHGTDWVWDLCDVRESGSCDVTRTFDRLHTATMNHVNVYFAFAQRFTSCEVIRTFAALAQKSGTVHTALTLHFSSAMDEESLTKIYQEKNSVRQLVKQRLNSLTDEEKTTQSRIVREKLYAHDAYLKSERISIFLNMSDEIQTLDILRKMLDDGKMVFIPRYSTKAGRMDMVRLKSWEDYENLPSTKWNIKQPSVDDPREDALDTGGLDLVIMPGLAFTKNGRRLGRGKGYYDSFLRRCESAPAGKPRTVAVAFKEQILPDIPITPKDVIIDGVLSADE